MKERPILFSGPMVRAILEGRKTQTRRVMKDLPVECGDILLGIPVCPYGVSGDRLWVRETFMHTKAEYEYSVSCTVPYLKAETIYAADVPGVVKGAGFKPSIHMPRGLSRITLEITDVRVQRLQEISEEDAKAEGVYQETFKPTYRTAFGVLWDSINAKRGFGWDVNPWVWAISFQSVQTHALA